MLTVSDIDRIIKEYCISPAGQRALKEQGVEDLQLYNETEMVQLANELRDDIINAYLGVVKSPDKYFDIKTTRISEPRVMSNKVWKVNISFSGKGLSRRSLAVMYDTNGKAYNTDVAGGSIGFTGKGVYDIFGLFTQGYSTKRVFGEWWDNQSDLGTLGIFIGSMAVRHANSFISDTIHRFEAQHPYVEVNYPKLWGGNL